MNYLVVDIECESLTPDIIWVAVTKDLQTNEVKVWLKPHENNTQEFVSYLSNYTLIGHNILSFDLPVINRLCSSKLPLANCYDTLVIARLANSWNYRTHSLDDWGQRLGKAKIKFDNFEELTQEMIDYCIQDVEVTATLFNKYRKGLVEVEEYQKAIRLEHDSAILCDEIQRNGFYFDLPKAQSMYQEITQRLSVLTEEIKQDFKPKSVFIREINPTLTAKGTIHKKDFRFLGDIAPEEAGFKANAPFSLFEFKEFNPGSPKQRIEVLNECGWKPTDKTDGHIKAERENDTSRLPHFREYGWKTSEENLNTLPVDAPEGSRKLVEWITLDSRRSTLEEWINSVDTNDNRIHGTFNHIGSWTHRKSHNNPNMANIPASAYPPKDRQPTEVEKINIKYNGEMRSLWTVPKKRMLVGTDAEGIQLRVLAHYINNPEYTKSIVDGKKEDESDIHNVNKRALGLNHITRDDAKTFIYAWLLGAGTKKISQILRTDSNGATFAMDSFLTSIDGLSYLKNSLIPNDAAKGYFKGLDNRLVVCDSEHKMLAGYLQNGESVIMKWANRIWYNKLKKKGIWFAQVNDVHDEWQTEVEECIETARYVALVQREAIRQAGEELGVQCRLDGSSEIGYSWLDTH
jgi:DNA polymerase-1